jgi:hypothetical protein
VRSQRSSRVCGVPIPTFHHRTEGSRGSDKFVPAVTLPAAAHLGSIRQARIRAILSDSQEDDGIRQSYSLHFLRAGIGYQVTASYDVAMTPERWQALPGKSQMKWAQRHGEMRYVHFPDHLVEVIEDLNVEAIAPGTPELQQTEPPRLPYGVFSFLPPRDEFDWSIRAGLYLPDHRLHPRPFAGTLEQIASRANWIAYEGRMVIVTYDP